jgi:hypothetical protein
MKATISLGGRLSIIPESEIEHYALAQWWAGFNQPLGSGTTELHVAIPPEDSAALKARGPLTTPPTTPTPSTQRAQRLLDKLQEGGLPAVLRHLAGAWSARIGPDHRYVSSELLEHMAAELEGQEVQR